MALRIEIRQGEAPLTVKDAAQLDEALGQATEEARKLGMLGAVLIEAENGNVLTMVVGGDETVLGLMTTTTRIFAATPAEEHQMELNPS